MVGPILGGLLATDRSAFADREGYALLAVRLAVQMNEMIEKEIP